MYQQASAARPAGFIVPVAVATAETAACEILNCVLGQHCSIRFARRALMLEQPCSGEPPSPAGIMLEPKTCTGRRAEEELKPEDCPCRLRW